MMSNGDHFSDNVIPDEIAKNLNEYFPDLVDLSYEEVLQHQESVYQSLKGFEWNEGRSYQGQSDNQNQFSGQGGETSGHASFDSQIVWDEAYARSLELGDDFDELNISQSTSTATENREVSSRETPITPINRNVTQDDPDPDNMTYEQLQLLGESVGVENKGLSEELISRLPNFKFKTGMFSKKKEIQECVICCMMYKNGDKLTILPCAHQYHLKCITPWLKLSKNCPICQKEVPED